MTRNPGRSRPKRLHVRRKRERVAIFGFEGLDVYRCSIEFLALAWRLAEALPRGQSALGDQLRRAALSVPLNIAEGAGRIGDATTC